MRSFVTFYRSSVEVFLNEALGHDLKTANCLEQLNAV